jgi:DNA-binding LacI/PurR family transcriptional regulator
MATIYDVAREAGVSIATVSRVFHGKPTVGAELRHRVVEAAQKLGYQPHRLAGALARGRRNVIGLMLPSAVSHPFYGLLAENVARCAKEFSHEVVVGVPAESSMESYVNAATELQDGRVAGMLLCAGRSYVQAFLASRRGGAPPAVAIGCVPEVDAPLVTVDEETAGYELTRHLLGLGHRNIVFLGWEGEPRAPGREHGYARAMSGAGLPVAIRGCGEGMAGAAAAARELAARAPGMTAIIAFNDPLALGAMRGLYDAGLRVPEDVSVAGFDNIPQGACSVPALTTVAFPVEQLASHAIRVLGQRIGFCPDAPIGELILLGPTLVVRDSCTPPRAAQVT